MRKVKIEFPKSVKLPGVAIRIGRLVTGLYDARTGVVYVTHGDRNYAIFPAGHVGQLLEEEPAVAPVAAPEKPRRGGGA